MLSGTASPDLSDSLDNDNLSGVLLPPDALYTSDTATGQGASDSVDQILSYAAQGVGILNQAGVLGSKNPTGTITPNGANPVVNQPKTAQSWLQANPLLAVGIGVGALIGGALLYKAVK